MYYPAELVEEVRSKSDIVDIISGYVRLKRQGANYFGLCPFHSEKSASFSVSPSKQMYYCFGCGAGGNVVTFLMEYEHYTFPEAIQHLADRAGVALPQIEYDEAARKRDGRRAKLFEINKEAATYFYYQLRGEQGRQGFDYLKDRQLTEDTCKHFGLGFANKYSNDLTQYLKSKGFSEQDIIDAGLAAHDEKFGTHDKFWNRVMFPIQDANHRVIGFGGRVMGDGKPKYLNSPETEIFDKGRNLYGLNFARTSRKNQFILCEGYMDVISLHQAGFTQAVASLGTAFTIGQANILKRYSQDVLLAYDSDGAGQAAALRAITILRQAGMRGRVINMKPYKDPDEFIKNLGAEEYQKRLDDAENSFMFEVRILYEKYDMKDPEGKTSFQKEVAQKLCETFPEELERQNYIEAVADKYHMGYENLRRLVANQALTTGGAVKMQTLKSGKPKNTADTGTNKAERALITWITEEPALYPKIKKYISDRDFTDELYRQVAKKLFEGIEAGDFSPASIMNMFEDEEEHRKVAALFNTKIEQLENHKDREKAFHDIVVSVKENSFRRDTLLSGNDLNALTQAIAGKKALEELKKTHISLDT